jgi:hypothetical protein
MKKQQEVMVKCPKKISGGCKSTVAGCDHAVKHKRTRWCNADHCSCPSCVEIEDEKTTGRI